MRVIVRKRVRVIERVIVRMREKVRVIERVIVRKRVKVREKVSDSEKESESISVRERTKK